MKNFVVLFLSYFPFYWSLMNSDQDIRKNKLHLGLGPILGEEHYKMQINTMWIWKDIISIDEDLPMSNEQKTLDKTIKHIG